MTPLPSRASDAGPDTTPQEPLDWRDYIDEAADALHQARRTAHDDLARQRELRLMWLADAVRNIEQAIAALEMPARGGK